MNPTPGARSAAEHDTRWVLVALGVDVLVAPEVTVLSAPGVS